MSMLFNSCAIGLFIISRLQLSSALFVPNVTVIDAQRQTAYVDVAEIHNATLRFFNNGTYLFEVEMPCGILDSSGQRGRFQQREIVAPVPQVQHKLTEQEQREQELSRANQQRFLQAAALADQLQQPVRFANAIIQPAPLQPQIQPLSAVRMPASVAIPPALLSPLLSKVQRKVPRLAEDRAIYGAAPHSAQRCKCSCEDEESGQQTEDVQISVNFPSPKVQRLQNEAEPIRQNVQLASIEVAHARQKRTKRQAQEQKPQNRLCLFVEEGSWPQNQDGFIKLLAPSIQSLNLDTNDEVEQCALRFKKNSIEKVVANVESFKVECRGTAHCDRGQAEPTCAGGAVVKSKFSVIANGELLLSVKQVEQ